MSLQSMPIADRILRPGCPSLVYGQEPDNQIHYRISPILRDSFRLNAQVAAEIANVGHKQGWDVGSDFGPLRLPYPKMWFEWHEPETVRIDGKLVPAAYAGNFAAAIEEVPVGENEYTITTRLFIHNPANGMVCDLDTYDEIHVDRNGAFLDRHSNRDMADDLAVFTAGNVVVVYLAISLMNCRNVTTETAGRVAVRRTGKSKRRRDPQLDFHTIVLPGSTGGGEATGDNSDVMALHRARGHFKTYTADAPLMGKHVGTYWWGWQVRGRKTNGITVTDYKVGVTK